MHMCSTAGREGKMISLKERRERVFASDRMDERMSAFVQSMRSNGPLALYLALWTLPVVVKVCKSGG